MPFSLFSYREWLARAIALVIGLLMLIYQGALVIQHVAPSPVQAVQVKLVSLPEEKPKLELPPKLEPVPPKPVTKPQSVVKQMLEPRAVPQITPVVLPPRPEIMPVKTAAVDKPAPLELPISNKLETKPTVAAQPKGNADSEAGFARDVRKKIEQQKVYPASARELGMAGEVEVRYVIDRSGRLLEVEVTTSSGYPLLDRAAVRAVKAASFKSMLADNWPEVAQKEFRTKIVFSITD
jgi:protein TonB